MANSNNKILSVSEITGQIKQTLETGFDNITIRGEISNYKHHSSGHRYFSLKDDNAQISSVMWKFKKLNFLPENGMKVVARGSLSVFAPRGNYQISVEEMTPDGLGELYLAYEKLKKELESKGWFDLKNKKDLPKFPKKIGVSTSLTGAAIRDILTTIERRYPLAEVILRPTRVQGDGSSTDIVNAIQELNNADVDVIISGRGGGSIEDLWSYNTRKVAEAIFNSETPIISAVGHETDFTISDFVADLRAATPTAGAERATPISTDYIKEIIDSHKNFFKDILKLKFEEFKRNIEFYTEGRALRIAEQRVGSELQKIDNIEDRTRRIFNYRFQEMKNKFLNLESSIKLLNPKRPLESGYALIRKGDKIIGNSDSLVNHKDIEILRANETAKAKISKILPKQLL